MHARRAPPNTSGARSTGAWINPNRRRGTTSSSSAPERRARQGRGSCEGSGQGSVGRTPAHGRRLLNFAALPPRRYCEARRCRVRAARGSVSLSMADVRVDLRLPSWSACGDCGPTSPNDSISAFGISLDVLFRRRWFTARERVMVGDKDAALSMTIIAPERGPRLPALQIERTRELTKETILSLTECCPGSR